MSEDEFDLYDLPELTEDDFARIDAAVQLAMDEDKGGPKVTVQLEQPVVDIDLKATRNSTPPPPPPPVEQSPYDRFRPNGILSVSDLVGPVWCEVQFDYGLRQKRFRRLEDRPSSFTSKAGKEIVVKKKVAAQNDRRATRGKLVHKELEREIRPVEIRVDVTTQEERWALRLVNMVSCVDSLISLGCAREMPVFGIVHDHVVIGIIDEILRKPAPQHARRYQSDEMHSVPASDDSTATGNKPLPHSVLALVDTKTRHSDSIPAHDDTLPSRLQLMLYHRLLSMLISSPNLIDFSSLWTRLELDPSKPFSPAFTAQALLSSDVPQASLPSCLNDLTRLWRDAIQQLDITGVDRTLQLVYRDRNTIKRKSSKKTDMVVETSQKEADDIAKAVQASLRDIGGGASEDEQIAMAIAASLQDLGRGGSELSEGTSFSVTSMSVDLQEGSAGSSRQQEVGECESALAQADPPNLDVDSPGDTTDSSSETSSPKGKRRQSTKKTNHDAHTIIGMKKFLLDDNLLDNHLASVLEWWHGIRQPKGVELEQSKRCFTCEYYEGCEWREMKAKEFMRRFESNRA